MYDFQVHKFVHILYYVCNYLYLLSCSVVCKMLPGLILFLSCTFTSHSLSALVSSKNEEKLFHILWLQEYFYLKCCWQAEQRENNNMWIKYVGLYGWAIYPTELCLVFSEIWLGRCSLALPVHIHVPLVTSNRCSRAHLFLYVFMESLILLWNDKVVINKYWNIFAVYVLWFFLTNRLGSKLLDPQMYKFPQMYKTSLKCKKNQPQLYELPSNV